MVSMYFNDTTTGRYKELLLCAGRGDSTVPYNASARSVNLPQRKSAPNCVQTLLYIPKIFGDQFISPTMKILSLLFTAILANQCKKSKNWDKKPGFCTDVTTYITRTNSWVCKNCFNIRIEFNLGWLGPVGNWFDNRDYVWLAFKQPVSVIKWAGPSDGVVPDGNDEDGNYRFKMGFNDNAQFGDGRIDINVGMYKGP